MEKVQSDRGSSGASSCRPSEYARPAQRRATELAFTGEYTDTKTTGVYRCRACGGELFRSDAKFESLLRLAVVLPAERKSDAVTLIEDRSHGMIRVEARCANCDSHLGYVFTGEGYGTPTDERWCINSISLTLEPSGLRSPRRGLRRRPGD